MLHENTQGDIANLELSAAEMRAMGDAVLARAVEHLAKLPTLPSRGDYTGIEALCRSMRESAPEHGSELPDLLEPLFEDWIPRSFNTPGAGYLAYIPGGGVFPAALADFIADTSNRFTGVWQAAPALVQLEANALDWLRDWMQFPATTRGLFTTGGSMAMFNAIACARGHEILGEWKIQDLIEREVRRSLDAGLGCGGHADERNRQEESSRHQPTLPVRSVGRILARGDRGRPRGSGRFSGG